jgi:hypothetical protein
MARNRFCFSGFARATATKPLVLGMRDGTVALGLFAALGSTLGAASDREAVQTTFYSEQFRTSYFFRIGSIVQRTGDRWGRRIAEARSPKRKREPA